MHVLGTESPESATWLLIDLAEDPAVRARIAGIPGALQNLVELLKPYWMREVSLEALSVFAADEKIRGAIAAVPECLGRLQALTSLPDAEIQEGEDPGLRELAADVLWSLGAEAERDGVSAGETKGAGSEGRSGNGDVVEGEEAGGKSEGTSNGMRGGIEEPKQSRAAESNGMGAASGEVPASKEPGQGEQCVVRAGGRS